MVIEIPVYPHVRKLLVYKQLHPDQPLKADFTNRLGLTIRAILHSKAEKASANERMTSVIQVELNDYIAKCDHRMRKLVKINDYFDKDFKEIMIHSVEDQMEAGSISAFAAITNFLKRLGVTEQEYSHATAYREWLRRKNFEYARSKSKKSKQKLAVVS